MKENNILATVCLCTSPEAHQKSKTYYKKSIQKFQHKFRNLNGTNSLAYLDLSHLRQQLMANWRFPFVVKFHDLSDEQWVKTRQTRLTSTWRHYSAADIRVSVPDRKKTKLFQTKCSNQRASYTWSWMLLSLKFLLPLDVSQSEAKKAASFACRIHSPSVPWCPWNDNKMSARRFWLLYVLRDICVRPILRSSLEFILMSRERKAFVAFIFYVVCAPPQNFAGK